MSEIKNTVYAPFITHIPADNFIFSALEENTAAFQQFIMKYYIEFEAVFLEEEQNYIYRFKDSAQWNRFEEFSHIFIPTESIHKITDRDLVEMLEDGYLILTCINMKYISQYHCSRDQSHEIMICGADKETQEYLCKDYFNNVDYEFCRIGFSDIVKSMKNYADTGYDKNDTGLAALKLYKNGTKKAWDVSEYLEQLRYNVSSKKNSFDAAMSFITDRKHMFTLHDLFTLRVFFHFINENIRLFLKRLELISAKNNIRKDGIPGIVKTAEEFRKKVTIQRNVLLKSEVKIMWKRELEKRIEMQGLLDEVKWTKDEYMGLIDLLEKQNCGTFID